MTLEMDLPKVLHVIASPDALTIRASVKQRFWSPTQDDRAWSMVLTPSEDDVPGLYEVEHDDAYDDDQSHPRYLHASRCIARLQKHFPRLTRYFDDDTNKMYIQIHPDDLLHFRMFWEMID
jgi:hypothetical protein